MSKLQSVKDFFGSLRRGVSDPGNFFGFLFIVGIVGSIYGYAANIVKFLSIDLGAELTNEAIVRFVGIISPLGIPMGFL